MMKKILMCVFSGTGNTRKIANLFSDEFIKNGVETTIVDIKKGARIKCVDDFDAVGVLSDTRFQRAIQCAGICI